MRPLVFCLISAGSAPALAQDALQLVLQAAPHALVLAGSPENLANLVDGLTRGKPVRLVSTGPTGFNRVLTFTPPARLSPEQAADSLEHTLTQLLQQWDQVRSVDIPALNRQLKAANLPEIRVESNPRPGDSQSDDE